MAMGVDSLADFVARTLGYHCRKFTSVACKGYVKNTCYLILSPMAEMGCSNVTIGYFVKCGQFRRACSTPDGIVNGREDSFGVLGLRNTTSVKIKPVSFGAGAASGPSHTFS